MWWSNGPHLRRRIQVESGQHPTIRRRSSTFFKRSSDVEEFRDVLTSKFGSLTRAWRLGLDADQNGSLDFREFCSALKGIGFTGNVRTLFFNLDKDDSGSISLKELDPRAAAALEKFRAKSTLRYGSIPEMWSKLMDQDNSKTVSFKEFVANAGVLGYAKEDEEVWELFNLLLVRPGSTYITLDDILFLQEWEKRKIAHAHRQRLAVGWVNKDPYRRGTPIMPGTPDPDDYEAVVGVDVEKLKVDFQQFLIQKFDSLPHAFDLMDANGNGSLSLVEFQAVVSSVLRYCRPADAARLFLSFNNDPGAKLTWDELGISSPEWINYMLDKRTRDRQRRLQDEANRAAALGASPRELGATVRHSRRLKEPRRRSHLAFGTPLPQGWGLPPDFDPLPLSAR